MLEVDYLGHIVSGRGVAVDQSKVQAMWDWPIPRTLKALRFFLGQAGYYRKFIRGYSTITAPFTVLTKKNAFAWSEEAQISFNALKKALTTSRVSTARF